MTARGREMVQEDNAVEYLREEARASIAHDVRIGGREDAVRARAQSVNVTGRRPFAVELLKLLEKDGVLLKRGWIVSGQRRTRNDRKPAAGPARSVRP
jgi:hypothetical protein